MLFHWPRQRLHHFMCICGARWGEGDQGPSRGYTCLYWPLIRDYLDCIQSPLGHTVRWRKETSRRGCITPS